MNYHTGYIMHTNTTCTTCNININVAVPTMFIAFDWYLITNVTLNNGKYVSSCISISMSDTYL